MGLWSAYTMHRDDPVQRGRLVAVDLGTGHLITSGFPFYVDGAPTDMTCGGVCGGGVWDSPSYDGHGIVFTSGNVCDSNVFGSPPCQSAPSPDYSLSMINVDPISGVLNVIAIADPSVAPPVGYTCSSTDFGPPSANWMADCTGAGFSVVPVPASRDVALDDQGNAAGLRMEAAIALDKLYVATDAGHVYALWP